MTNKASLDDSFPTALNESVMEDEENKAPKRQLEQASPEQLKWPGIFISFLFTLS